MNEPFLLNPSTPHTQAEIDRNRDPQTPSLIQTSACPFFMGAVNTRIVRRSGALYEEWNLPMDPNSPIRNISSLMNHWHG